MNSSSFAIRDSATMLRLQLRHMRRYPSMTLMIIAMPVIFLLLFVYVFGGIMGAGLGGAAAGRALYVNFVTPGVLLITVAGGATGTAVSVATDMAEGIVARFRTMAISRASVLTGHVVGSLIRVAAQCCCCDRPRAARRLPANRWSGRLVRRDRHPRSVHLGCHMALRCARPDLEER